MILPLIGSLKVFSNLNRFQRRLESPEPNQSLSFPRKWEPPIP
jgi:hypothetical protein